MINKRQIKKQRQQPKQKQPEELRVLAAHKHEHNHQHQLTFSPFPSAIEMERMNALDPNYVNTIMRMAEQQIQADIENSKSKIALEQEEQNIRRLEVTGNIEHKKRGQNYGLIAMVFLGATTIVLAYLGAYKTAAAFATVTVIGGITAFTGFSNHKNKEQKETK